VYTHALADSCRLAGHGLWKRDVVVGDRCEQFFLVFPVKRRLQHPPPETNITQTDRPYILDKSVSFNYRVVQDYRISAPAPLQKIRNPAKSGSGQISSRICRMPVRLLYIQLIANRPKITQVTCQVVYSQFQLVLLRLQKRACIGQLRQMMTHSVITQ